MYHYTRELKHSRYPGIRGLDVLQFRHQIEFMRDNFNIVTMEQVIDSVTSGDELPDKALLLTFDDGYVDNYLYAFPILEEYGVQGTFFIPGKTFTTHQLLDVNKVHYIVASADENQLVDDVKSQMEYYRGLEYDFPSTAELWNQYAKSFRYDSAETIFVKRMLQTALPEKLRNQISSNLFEKYVGVSEEQLAYELYMTSDQIRTLKRHGMHIGVHGFDHYWLANLSEDEMKRDVDSALEALDGFYDREQWVMCYPYGSFNDVVCSYIKALGARVAFTTAIGIADLEQMSPLELPRLDCNDFPPKSEEYKNR